MKRFGYVLLYTFSTNVYFTLALGTFYERSSLPSSVLGSFPSSLLSVASGVVCGAECEKDVNCFGFGSRNAPSDNCMLLKNHNLDAVTPNGLEDAFDYYLAFQPSLNCTQTGPFIARPDGINPTIAYCKQALGEYWLVFQRRMDGSEDFYRNWNDYKTGFGDPRGEFWLGNDYLHHLTKDRNCVLRIEMEHPSGGSAAVEYLTFDVDDENSKYRLTVDDYMGGTPPGDSLISFHNNQYFSTYDQDNDEEASSCAVSYKGGWWYRSCHNANLNGLYRAFSPGQGIHWVSYTDITESLTSTMMMVKCESTGVGSLLNEEFGRAS